MPASMVRLVVLTLLLSSLVGACASTGERLIPWYVTRRIASYLDLTSAQKKDARVVVDDTLHVLRRSEIPHWIDLLREIRGAVHDGLDDARIARLQAKYDARLDAGVALLAPRLARLLTQLDAGQLDHFAERMREDVEAQYDELTLPPRERGPEIEKRALKVLRKEVGSLSDAQEDAVRALIRALPNERVKQHASALDHIARFRAFLAVRRSDAEIASTLSAMWDHRYDALGVGRDKTARRAEQRAWLLGVYRLLTSTQRAHVEAQITERIEMLKRFAVIE
ncbi:MAG: DUF6279 family lipoprotein [Polyangiales bacterium]